jgi:hypothetical protein
MITLELRDVEVDHCICCGGIWLDEGEVELLLDDRQRAIELLDSFKVDGGCGEVSRKCPICRRKMQKVGVGSGELPLMIDKCSRKHGLWFDKGELEQIVKKAKLNEANKIGEVLADMFGKRMQP